MYQLRKTTKTKSKQARLEGQQSFGVYQSVLEKTGMNDAGYSFWGE